MKIWLIPFLALIHFIASANGQAVQQGSTNISLEQATVHLEEARPLIFKYPDSAAALILPTEQVIMQKGIAKQKANYYNVHGLMCWQADEAMEAVNWFQKTLNLSQTDELLPEMAEAANNAGALYRRMGITDSARVYLQRALDIDIFRNNIRGINKTRYDLGIMEMRIGHYDLALEQLSEVARSQEATNDSSSWMNTLTALGNLYYYKDNTENATEYYKSSLNIAQDLHDSTTITMLLTNLSAIIIDTGGNNEARTYARIGIAMALRFNDYNSLMALYGNLAQTFLIEGQNDSTIYYYQKALNLTDRANNLYLVNSFYNLMAKAYQKTGRQTEAYTYYLKAKENSRKMDDRPGLRDALLGLATIDSLRGNYKLALTHFCEGTKWRDSINNTESTNRFSELEIKYKTEKNERLIEDLKAKDHYNKLLRISGILFTLAAIAVLLMLLLLISKQKRLSKQQVSILENEKALSETLLESKKKELTAHVLSLAKSEELLKEVNTKIEDLIPEVGYKASQQLNTIINTLKSKQNSQKLWHEFEQRFDELNNGFISKILEQYPNLSPTEVRMCALLRLQLSTKEIAELTQRSPRTIEYTRANIRRKMGLSSSDNLLTKLLSL